LSYPQSFAQNLLISARDHKRSQIDKITLKPNQERTDYAIDLHGDLAGILTIAAGKQKKIAEYDPLFQQVKMITSLEDSQLGKQDK
jgi:hypothetical protein